MAYPETYKIFNESLKDLNSTSNTTSDEVSDTGEVFSSSSSSESSVLNISSSSTQTSSEVSSVSSSLAIVSSQSSIAASVTPAVKTVTTSQLAANKSSGSCWVSYKKKVYNVSSYLSKHPGGRQELLNVCGQQIDSLSNGHSGGSFGSSKIQNILGDFFVGNLV